MIRKKEELDGLAKRLEALLAEKEGYSERFGFFKRVLKLLFDLRADMNVAVRRLEPKERSLKIDEGFPMMDRLKLQPNLEAVERNFERLWQMVKEERKIPVERIVALERIREGIGDFKGHTLQYFREGEEKITALAWSGDDRDLWLFLLFCSIKPYYEIHALSYAEKDDFKTWEKGYCPVCGGLPSFGGLMDEEGKRRLLCHRCNFIWGFRRVRCPFCETAEGEKLRYIFFEGEPLYRIDVCNNCRGYLRTADSRKYGEGMILEAEDLATPHLDLVAEKEGYTKKSPNILGL